jgi:pimeloyl-ACP methyl ester carboxylesterase
MTTGLEIDPATAVALPVTQWGAPRASRTALLLHGLSSAGAVWWRVADGLAAQGFRVVAPDLRGHGDAPRTLRYPLGAFAADVLRLRPSAERHAEHAADPVSEQAAVPWDVVVGHSLGGAVAALALASDAAWARTAVLVDPALRQPGGTSPGALAFRQATVAEVEAPDAAAIRAANPDWHPEDVHLKVRAARQTSRHTIEGVLDDTAEWDLPPLLERLELPVAVLGADPARGAVVSSELGARLAAANEKLRYTVVAGAGHSVHRSHPERVVAEVLELTGASAPAAS